MKTIYYFLSIFLIMLLQWGCGNRGEFRSPSKAEWSKGDIIARGYAATNLQINSVQLSKIKTDKGYISKENGKELLNLQFFDPTKYPEKEYAPDGVFHAIMGGFPAYFCVTIDMSTWQVVSHRASRE